MANGLHDRLTKLELAIGREDAQREFKQMKQSQPDRSLDVLDRRIAGEPLAYVLGQFVDDPGPIPLSSPSSPGISPFGPINLLARPPTLIPRSKTADWTHRLTRTRTPSSTHQICVLDLFTGSGCISLLLCHLCPPASTHAVGVDYSPDAIRLATDNIAQSRILERQNTFKPLVGDIPDPDLIHRLDPRPPFDVITGNPPTSPKTSTFSRPSLGKGYEDPRAIINGALDEPNRDGLSFYHATAAFLARKGVLARGATIALQVRDTQGQAVMGILRDTPGLQFGEMEVWKDESDNDRVVFAHAA